MSLETGPNGRSGKRMIVRRDHVAGGAFVIGGALVFAMSGELPFGTLASPGAGMMPKLVLTLLVAFGALLVLRAGESPPLAELLCDTWRSMTDLSCFGHAVTAPATALSIAVRAMILPDCGHLSACASGSPSRHTSNISA